MSSSGSRGWVPKQHGAWAMLFTPLVVGIVVRSRGGLPAWCPTLAITWLAGYFCFNACGLWLKAAPRRRASYRPPVLTYGALTAVAGLATLLLGGWPLLWWIPVFAPLLGTALWLTGTRRERSLVSGLCTVLAACLLCPVLEHTTPQAFWAAGLGGGAWRFAALAGYFFGTVFVVKTLIRERGKPGWVTASIGWHAVWTLLAALAAVQGVAGWPWVALFAVGTLRAWALPWFGPRAGRTIRPAQVGALEAVLSLVALVLCLVATP